MSATVANEIAKAVHKARNCALYCDYNTALRYYNSIRNEINSHTRSMDDALGNQWMRLLGELESEAHIIRDTQAELELYMDPNAVNRQGPTECDENHVSRSSERTAVAKMGIKKKPRICASPVRGGGSNVGVQNAKLYGDKDRFGPTEGPQITQALRPPARNAASSYSALSPPFPSGSSASPVPPRVSRTFSNNGVGASGRPVASSGAGFRQGVGVSSGTGAPARGKVKTKNAAPRFVGRPGEEELVQLIEADMHVGKLPVTWDDIAGLEEAKRLLEEAVVYPVLMPDYYQGIRRPWKGVLMYGPPGTGKTMLAKAVASECNTTFFNISPATLTSKWRGDSEKLIRVLFEMARHYAPSTIFIDEIDSLCGQRGGSSEHEASRRAKGTLLAQMDGVGVDSDKIVMVLGATNHPWDIDEAMRRRLEKRIYISLPDAADRVELFKINTKSIKLGSDVDFVKLSHMLEGRHYSGADITNLVRDAAMMTMRRFMQEADKTTLKTNAAEIGRQVAEQPINMNDFLAAIKKVPSSINAANIKKFEAWKKEFEVNI
ncbi:katanin, putative [Leishmania tarentolae]|uniref:Katanin p60 ATPase-containing subunit A1 n=1 Tax=Leishmania tarentolae TaxID=5689 RepID=A0A640KR05_LEITA|nr:katanin, putative [Leishmania tarentolae]